jgi:hypothetical protein
VTHNFSDEELEKTLFSYIQINKVYALPEAV